MLLHCQVAHMVGLAFEIAKSTILAHLVLVLSLSRRSWLEQIGLHTDTSPL